MAAFGPTPFSWKEQSIPELRQQSSALFLLLKLHSQSFIPLANNCKTYNIFGQCCSQTLVSDWERSDVSATLGAFSGKGSPLLCDVGSFPFSCPVGMGEFLAGKTHL